MDGWQDRNFWLAVAAAPAVWILLYLVTGPDPAALHFLYRPLPWAALVFVPSLIFGYFKDKYHGLSAPIQLHIFYNTGYYWIFGGDQ